MTMANKAELRKLLQYNNIHAIHAESSLIKDYALIMWCGIVVTML